MNRSAQCSIALAGMLIGVLTACGSGPDGSGALTPAAPTTATAESNPPATGTPPVPGATPIGTSTTPPAGKPATGKPPTGKPATSKPPTSKPPTAKPPAAPVGELALAGPASCDWVPHALLDGRGGVAIHFGVGVTGLSGTVDITVSAVRGGNVVGRNSVHLGSGDSDVDATLVTAAVAGSDVLSVAVVLDFEQRVRQPSGTYQDTAVVTVSVPTPRPTAPTTLSCVMAQ